MILLALITENGFRIEDGQWETCHCLSWQTGTLGRLPLSFYMTIKKKSFLVKNVKIFL